MRPEALIHHVVGGAGAGFVVFRDVRGLLSVVRDGSSVFSDLQGHELSADAAGVLLWGPAADGFPVEAAVTCAVVTRTGESWWVVTDQEASPQEWTLFGEDADVEGLLPCPAVELAAARRHVTGAAVVDVPHGANTPMTWVVARAAELVRDFARRCAADSWVDHPPARFTGRDRAAMLAAAEDLLLARMVGDCFMAMGVALPLTLRVAISAQVDEDTMEPDVAWQGLQNVGRLVEPLPWDLCDATLLASSVRVPQGVDPVWWGSAGVGGLALLRVGHLADSLEETFDVDEQLGQLAFTRLGSLFASHRGPHGVS